jgi:3-mercaptopyruvate sulfurtransferase SseA
MKELGVEGARALKGGMQQWESAGNKLVTGDKPK